jgi:cysteine dioxygenase
MDGRNITTIPELLKIISEDIKNNGILIDLIETVDSYNGNDYIEYVKYDDNSYHRNCIYIDNNIEVYIISWKSNQETKIHDHPKKGCLLRILENELEENLYNKHLQNFNTNILTEANTSYIEGDMILHKIKNNTNKNSVSLHIYSPPNYNIKYYENKN